jgi:hypothetical protein
VVEGVGERFIDEVFFSSFLSFREMCDVSGERASELKDAEGGAGGGGEKFSHCVFGLMESAGESGGHEGVAVGTIEFSLRARVLSGVGRGRVLFASEALSGGREILPDKLYVEILSVCHRRQTFPKVFR